MKNANAEQDAAVASAVSWLSTTIDERDDREDRQVAEERASCGHLGADAERRGDERRDREPREPRARLGRRVQPGREHGEQRERPVGVVEVVGRAVMVGEEQQPERDLRDEQRLREGEQVRDRRARRAAAAPRTPPPTRRGRRRSAGMRSRGGPLASATTLSRGTHVVEEGKPAPDFELDERQPARPSSSPTCAASRSSSTSIPRTTRPAARRRRAASATSTASSSAPARSCSASRPTTRRSHVKFKEKYELPFTLLADPDHAVAERVRRLGREEVHGPHLHGRQPLDLRDRRGRQREEGDAQVKPDTHADDVLAVLAA